MKDYVNEHLRKHTAETPVRPRMKLADGTTISVQASSGHYCTPRESGMPYYSHVEVGYPDDMEPFSEWAECSIETGVECPTCGTVAMRRGAFTGIAGWVPVEKVNEYIEKRGGIE